MDITKIKENLKNFYNKEADARDSSVKLGWKLRIREEYCGLIKLENKTSLIELGAGAGHDSLYFMNNGLQVTAVDISVEMAAKCAERGIEAYVLDYYEIKTLNRKFDCAWAVNTLLHVPKGDLPHVLDEISGVLNEGGLFYLGLYGGNDSEMDFVKSDISDVPRFYALHSEKFLRSVLENRYEILSYEPIEVTDRGPEFTLFHSFTLRRK